MSDDPNVAGAPIAAHAAAAPPPPEPAPAPPLPTVAQPAPAPLPVQVAAEQPAPAAVPPVADEAADVPGDDMGALRAELAAELERTRSAREAVEAISTRAEQRARVDYLRRMGASDSLSDEHLLTLAPDADPSTPGGSQALQAWRDDNGALFAVQAEGATQTEQVSARMKSSAHGTFGAEFHRAQMRATFGGE